MEKQKEQQLHYLTMEQDLEAYKDITLTDQEISNALFSAKKIKKAEIDLKAYWERVNQPKVYTKHTNEELYKVVMARGKSMFKDFSEELCYKEIYTNLCYYFTEDPRFEINGFSLSKGLIIHGNIGCGKTTMMRLFCDNQKASYEVTSCRKVSSDYAKLGSEAIDFYSNLCESLNGGLQYGHSGVLGFCFDDLGTEENRKHFGNESNVMAEIIQNRYDKKNKLSGKTHMTTNLSAEQIGEVYGTRVKSRMREMFNIIEFPKDAPDRRI